MTKEEAINQLQDAKDGYKEYLTDEALDMAIDALEQYPIVDKIRAEIEEVIQEETVIDNSGGEYERIVSTVDLDDVLEILDKYKAESEVEE